MTRTSSKTFVHWITGIIILCAFFFLGRHVYLHADEIMRFEWRIDIHMLVASTLLSSLLILCQAFGWYLILRTLNSPVELWQCIRIYMISQLGRYIPGKVMLFVGRVLMSEQMGISKTLASLSVLFEAVLFTAGAIFGIGVLYAMTHKIHIIGFNPWIIGGVLIAGMAMLYPPVTRRIMGALYFFKFKSSPSDDFLRFRYHRMVLICIYYTVLWVLMGFSFYLFVRSVAGSALNPDLFADTACIYLVSWMIGFLSLVTPGGMGVRETVMAVMFQQILPVYLVSAISLLSRLWATAAELIGVLIACLIPVSNPIHPRHSSAE